MSAEVQGRVKIPLLLASGAPVGVTVLIPPFLTMPEVIVWGCRTFVRQSALDPDAFDGSVKVQYREAFCYHAIEAVLD